MIDGIGQSDMPGELVHGGDTSVADGMGAISKFVFDRVGSENGIRIRDTARESILPCSCEPFDDLLLACTDTFCET
jgi:hypothetical protein